MNRDHALTLLVGLFAGFLLGYIAHEAMAGIQPQRLPPGGAGQAAIAPPAAGGAAPAMAEIQSLQETLERNPQDTEAMLRLANLNFDIQRWDRAGELYERYLALRPDDPDVTTDLGITLRARGDLDRALALFRAVQQRDPDHWQARYNEIIVLAFDRRDFAAAETALAALERRRPGQPEVERLAAEVRRLKDQG